MKMKRVSVVSISVVALSVITGVGVAWLLLFDRSARFDDWVCVSCGVRKQHIRQWRWTFEIKNRELMYNTAVSQALNPLPASTCHHCWKLAHFDIHGGRYRASAHGRPGGDAFELLSRDERFAGELAVIAKTNAHLAGDVWTSLCNASFRTNRQSDQVYDWIIAGNDREPLLQWFPKAGLTLPPTAQ